MAETPVARPNVRDAAVLLLSLGEQAAADVLQHLGPKDLQRIGKAMATVGQVSVAQVSHALSTFLTEVRARNNSAHKDEVRR
ncbi:MAG TPA: hypothetical protein VK700_13220 [Steroidobacteraceae bacterium]|jgi:flagellar motor switch protein FliG|nr:hypothetical protein [Steroidobacteraceae bacterium]